MIRLKSLSKSESSTASKALPSFMHEHQEKLKQHFRTPVLIQQNAKGRGKIIIKYKNAQEFQRIVEMVGEID